MGTTDRLIEQLEAAAAAQQPLLKQSHRAAELKNVVPPSALSFAVCGVELDFESCSFLDDVAQMRQLTNPPGIVHLCGAAEQHHFDYMRIARFTAGCKAEIAMQRLRPEDTDQFLSDLVWHGLVLLKLRGQTALFCPAVASHSWDTIAAEKGTVRFRTLDDVSGQIVLDRPAPIHSNDIEWVKKGFMNAMQLRDTQTSRRFGLAFRIAYTWNHTQDLGVALVNLWIALEALFSDPNDPPGQRTAQMAKRISHWTQVADAAQVRDLYSSRCDVVHGRAYTHQALISPTRETQRLLNDSLIKCIDTCSRTLQDDAR